jgi:starch phosphorylase
MPERPGAAATDVRVLAGAAELRERIDLLADRLPAVLKPLAAVAYNYHWAWTRDGPAVFADIAPHRWQLSRRNPVRFLEDLSAVAAASVSARPELARRIEALAAEHDAYLARQPSAKATLERPVVFLCSEFGFHVSMPIYSGGLGTLAGDILKEASDQGVPMIGIAPLYRRGYFHQRLDRRGRQLEYWLELDPEMLPMARLRTAEGAALELEVTLHGRPTRFHVWRVDIGRATLYLLDCEVTENDPVQRWTTARLYEGTRAVRLAQYGLLGMGSARLLRTLGIEPAVIHLNEGHPALAALELAAGLVEQGVPSEEALGRVRERVVFTTHTPVPAGNETYEPHEFLEAFAGLPGRVGLTDDEFLALCRVDGDEPGMSPLAIRMSRTRNGVSRLHGEVARAMWQPLFPGTPVDHVPITHVTNGAHVATFVAEPIFRLFARHLGRDWLAHAADPERWEQVSEIPNGELWAARCEARSQLVEFAREKGQRDRLLRGEPIGFVRELESSLRPDALTLGFARRLATYKRLQLLTHDPGRARAILGGPNPVQVLISGKAHPRDEAGKEALEHLFRFRSTEGDGALPVVFLEDYDLEVARHLVAGCDVWINLPRRPQEASGTSGMKATFNGVLQLSVLDGWWAEAYDGSNGWAIAGEADDDPEVVDAQDAARLYDLLENEVIPLFCDRDADGVPQRWCELIKRALVTCAPRFSSTRMLDEYVTRIYTGPDGGPAQPAL